MDTQISDYEVLTETKIKIKSLTSCPRPTTHLLSVMGSEFFNMGLSSGRSFQSRMLSFLSETKCPQMTPQPPCGLTPSETIESECGPCFFRPSTLRQQLPSCHDAVTMVAYCTVTLSSHQGVSISLNRQLVIQVESPKQRPLACPRSVSSAPLWEERFNFKQTSCLEVLICTTT